MNGTKAGMELIGYKTLAGGSKPVNAAGINELIQREQARIAAMTGGSVLDTEINPFSTAVSIGLADTRQVVLKVNGCDMVLPGGGVRTWYDFLVMARPDVAKDLGLSGALRQSGYNV